MYNNDIKLSSHITKPQIMTLKSCKKKNEASINYGFINTALLNASHRK